MNVPVFLPMTRTDLKLRHYRAYLPNGHTWEFSAFDNDEAARIFRDVILEQPCNAGATFSEVAPLKSRSSA